VTFDLIYVTLCNLCVDRLGRRKQSSVMYVYYCWWVCCWYYAAGVQWSQCIGRSFTRRIFTWQH